VRFLNLQEFSSKGLLDQFGVRNQNWRLASSPEEALAAAKELKKSTPPPSSNSSKIHII
jgi:succinyl-CoA synthetase beta subunit